MTPMMPSRPVSGAISGKPDDPSERIAATAYNAYARTPAVTGAVEVPEADCGAGKSAMAKDPRNEARRTSAPVAKRWGRPAVASIPGGRAARRRDGPGVRKAPSSGRHRYNGLP